MTLYIGFVLLSALLLWSIIYARGPWPVKLALIVTVPAYGVVVWHSIEQWKGYPVHGSPPEAALVAQLVDEPVAIYVWLVLPDAEEPRAYRIPYSRQTHGALEQGRKAAEAGRRVGFRRSQGRYEVYELPVALPSKEVVP